MQDAPAPDSPDSPDSPPPQRRPRRLLERLALVLASLVLADLAAGLLLPSDNNFRTTHPWYHHGLIPMTHGLSQWGTGSLFPVAVNSLGFIDSSVRTIPLASAQRRIVLLGDSFTEGIGMPFEMSFAGLLQERFADEGVEVLNAAVMSFSPKLYRLRLEHLLEQVGLEFDELVLLLDISDIQDQVLYRKFVPRRESSWERTQRCAWRWVRSHSFLVNTVDKRLNARRKSEQRRKYNTDVYPPWLDYFWLDNQDSEAYRDPAFPRVRSDWTGDELFSNEWTELGIALALEDMRAIVELCRAHEIKLTLGVYPWPRQIRNGEFECRQAFLWETFCAENGLDFINLFNDFLPTADYDPEAVYLKYYIDGDVHWNDVGHRLVADRIERYLRE